VKRLPLILALLLVALAAIETARGLTAPGRVPSADEWQRAAQKVRAGLQKGDLIVFAPRWVDQVGRFYLGDQIPVEMAGRADSDRYQRVWEVAIRGAHAEESAHATKLEQTHFGRVTVTLYEKGAAKIVHDFTSDALRARVTQAPTAGKGDEVPCLADGAVFRCGATPAMSVGPRTLEIDYRPRRGILVPATDGKITRLEFLDVPLGHHLIGYTGIHDYYSRKNSDAPVELALFIDGGEKLRVTTRNQDAWRRFDVDTSALAGTRHTIRFEVSAAHAAWRTFGFHAEARE
jgi:hypothetical protein